LAGLWRVVEIVWAVALEPGRRERHFGSAPGLDLGEPINHADKLLPKDTRCQLAGAWRQ